MDDFEAALIRRPAFPLATAWRDDAKRALTAQATTSSSPSEPRLAPTPAIAPTPSLAAVPAQPLRKSPPAQGDVADPSDKPSSVVGATPSCIPSARRVALVVGNAAYPGNAQLTNPANDADDVSDVLRVKLCFSVIEAKDATLAVFSEKISEFAEAAEGADVALFYYAGHGMQFQGINLLIPVDARFANEYDALHGNVSAQDVLSLLESRAHVSLVFLDACRNNPIEEEFQRRIRTAGRGFGDTRGLAPMTTHGSETLVVFATRPNERAADGTGRNSPFTQAFLESIASPGEDIELVMRDISAKVRERTGGRQVPQRLTELEHGLTLVPAH
jgi:uncharacterized caspase-like protein